MSGEAEGTVVDEQVEAGEGLQPISADDLKGHDDQSDSDDEGGDDLPGEVDEPKDGDGGEAPRKKSNYQRRLEKALHRMGTAEGQVKELQRQIQALQGGQSSERREEIEDNTPRRDQFGDDESYVKALTKHTVDVALSNSQPQQPGQPGTGAAAFRASEDAIRKTHPDYDKVVKRASDIIIPNAAVGAILESPNGGAIRYYLATHADEADRLMQMSEVSAVREIGKLEARIELGKRKVSSAPDPIPPAVGGRGASSVPRDRLSDDEWMARRNAELAKKR